MFQRRAGVIVLATVVSLGIVFAVQAGDRKRARRSPVQTPTNPGGGWGETSSICPQYIQMRMSTYCIWYSIKCVNGQIQGPCAYYGSCTLSPEAPCNCSYNSSGPPGTNCALASGMDGFSGELSGRTTIPAKEAVKVPVSSSDTVELQLNHSVLSDVVAKVSVPGKSEAVYVQLIAVATKPQYPIDPRILKAIRVGSLMSRAGSQVSAPDKVDFEIVPEHVKLAPGRTNVLVVTFQGDDYIVHLKKD